ncbi:MAG: terminase large subunit [Caudoviricetes sp.]|nr:MAG: terminase large subunit [Caudoviricetes sp.]
MLKLNHELNWLSTTKAKFKIVEGGRGGGKSHDFAGRLIMHGTERPHRILCCREYQKNLRESVYTLLIDKIHEDPYFEKFYKIKHDTIVGKNRTTFSFSGIKNARNLKSFEGCTICWVEEAQTLSQESLDFLLPTIRVPGSEIWFSFNPMAESDPIYQFGVKNILNLSPEILRHQKINYDENPFFAEEMIATMVEPMRKYQPEKFRNIWLGEPMQMSDTIIFKNKFFQKEFEVTFRNGRYLFDNKHIIDYHHGIDFGFRHPFAAVRSFSYDHDLYIDAEIYEYNLDLDDIVPMLEEEMPEAVKKRYKIYADNSRPETIEYLRKSRIHKNGNSLPPLNIDGAIKGPNSVKEGIEFLKNFRHIYVAPKCKNMLYEFGNYRYKENNKTGEILNEIVKEDDHLIDALRYSWNKEIVAQGKPIKVSNDAFNRIANALGANANLNMGRYKY